MISCFSGTSVEKNYVRAPCSWKWYPWIWETTSLITRCPNTDHSVHTVRLKFVYCMIRNVHFYFPCFFPMVMLTQTKMSFHFLLFFLLFFFLNEVFLTILYFWWYCVFIYSKCRQLKEVIPLNVLKLLVTGEGRGFCLVSHHWGHGAHNNSRTGYVKQCTERQTRSVLMLCWFSCNDLFYQVWLVTLKYTLIWQIFEGPVFLFLHIQLYNVIFRRGQHKLHFLQRNSTQQKNK